MNYNGRMYIRILAGGYLGYTGIRLLKGAISDRPGNYMIYILFGVAFIIIGALLLVHALIKLSKGGDEVFGEEDEEGTEGVVEEACADDMGTVKAIEENNEAQDGENQEG